MSYKEMNKSNTSFEDFKKACYERAKEEPDYDYAMEGLANEGEMECLYRHGKSVDSAVYLLCY